MDPIQELPLQPAEQVYKYLLTQDEPDWNTLTHHHAFSEKWLVFFLKRSRPIPRRAVEEIYHNRNFRKYYQVNLHLMRCKTAPAHVSISLVNQLRWLDLYWSLRLPYLPGGVRKKIEMQILEIMPRLALGEQVTLAKQAPRCMIKHFRKLREPTVVRALLQNFFFTYEDAQYMASHTHTARTALEEIAQSQKWTRHKEIRMMLLRHEQLANALRLPLARTLNDDDRHKLLRTNSLTQFTRHLLHRIQEQRYHIKRAETKTKEAQQKGETNEILADENRTGSIFNR